MEIKELIEKSEKELEKLRENIEKAMKEETNQNIVKQYSSDLKKINQVSKILQIKGTREILNSNTTTEEKKQLLSQLPDNEFYTFYNFCVANNILHIKNLLLDEKTMRKQYSPFLNSIKEKGYMATYQQGYRVVKIQTEEGDRWMAMIGQYEALIKQLSRRRFFLDSIFEARKKTAELTRKFYDEIIKPLRDTLKQGGKE
jgi:hypothetical protein